MSLYGMMRTGASGMNAQASRLGTVADNIANSNTTGYKKASAEFSSLILPSGNGSYNSGGVTTDVRYAISQQGALEFTSSGTDLALDGDGFFIVTDASGIPYLTRAGSFVPNGDGNLVNAAGYMLMGYDYGAGVPTPVVNGFDGLSPINVGQGNLSATPSTSVCLPPISMRAQQLWLRVYCRRPTQPMRNIPARAPWSSMTILVAKCCSTSTTQRPLPTTGKCPSTTVRTRRRTHHSLMQALR